MVSLSLSGCSRLDARGVEDESGRSPSRHDGPGAGRRCGARGARAPRRGCSRHRASGRASRGGRQWNLHRRHTTCSSLLMSAPMQRVIRRSAPRTLRISRTSRAAAARSAFDEEARAAVVALARGGRRHRAAGRRRPQRLRRQHRVRRAQRDAHLREPTSAQLQRNLVRSHSTGVGPDLARRRGPRDDAPPRAGARARPLAACASRSSRRSSRCSNAASYPRIPSQGSVGASGDLAPLAHLALAMIGEGEAAIGGRTGTCPSARRARSAPGIAPVVLEAKEGLALINGTQYMASLGTLALLEAERLCVGGRRRRRDEPRGAQGLGAPVRRAPPGRPPAPGPGASSRGTCARSSPTARSWRATRTAARCRTPTRSAACRRCTARRATRSRWVRAVLEREVNSVTDNPSVFVDDGGEADDLSGGNFHGQPLALALDLAAIAAAELANISERRVEQLVNPALSTGPHAVPRARRAKSGLHSGFMIAQVASASLVSENKVLCHPASVDSIPSSAGKEDHVSMGSVERAEAAAGRRERAARARDRGHDGRRGARPAQAARRRAAASRAALAKVRERVAPMTERPAALQGHRGGRDARRRSHARGVGGGRRRLARLTCGASGGPSGTRTRMLSRAADFKSAAYADSAKGPWWGDGTLRRAGRVVPTPP